MQERSQFTVLIRSIFLLGGLSLALVLHAQFLNSRSFEEHAQLVEMNQVVQREVATAHIWFEEALGGDASIDVQRDVYQPIDNAIGLINAALNSPSSAALKVEDRFPIRAELIELHHDLIDFQQLARSRWASGDTTGAIGGVQDQEFDALFSEIMRHSGSIAAAISEFINMDQDRILITNIVNLLILLAIFVGLASLIIRHRRSMERRSQELENLVAERTASLSASEAQARQRSEELAIARDEARAASQAKGRFLANMGHEIRTPMNGVLGVANLLSRTSLTPLQRNYVDTMQSSGLALLHIINDILDYSKIESGKMTLEMVDFELKDIFDDTIGLFSAVAAEKNLILRSNLAPDVPERVRGDPIRLGEVFSNLVSNAIKFSSDAEVCITCRLAESHDRYSSNIRLLVEVTDQGIGIEPKDIERLFEHFSQADSSTTRQQGGTGLGLAICRELVKLMGGEIGVRSTPGEGSTFWFEVDLERPVEQLNPVVEAGVHATDREQTPAPARIHAGVTQGGTILVIDDNETNLMVAQHMLRELGFEVELARNGPSAIDAARRSEFSAILVDSQMPGMDGNQTTRILRAMERDGRHTPIIALTANVTERDRLSALEAGVDDYLRKPIFIADLERALSRLLPEIEDDRIVVREVRPGSETACTAVLDEKVVAELSCIESASGEHLFATLAEQIMEQVPDALDSLRRAAAVNDRESIRRHAHALRGSLLQIGANRFALACRSLETEDAAAADSSRFLQTLEEMALEYQCLSRELANRQLLAIQTTGEKSGGGTSPGARRPPLPQERHSSDVREDMRLAAGADLSSPPNRKASDFR